MVEAEEMLAVLLLHRAALLLPTWELGTKARKEQAADITGERVRAMVLDKMVKPLALTMAPLLAPARDRRGGMKDRRLVGAIVMSLPDWQRTPDAHLRRALRGQV